ncbi:LptF/LptG family permease [candidate division KSB1 bacterium]|nr:LptF/LptG family permease [candidate division KSB1 bacterium]
MILNFLIIQRYILKRHFGPFIFSLLIITLLFLLNLVFRILGRILSKGLDFAVIIEFFILNLAWIIAMAVPMAVLTAALMAFGTLSADNETTALKASGINLLRIIGFNLIIASLLAVGLIWFNNSVLPNFNHRARLLGTDINAKRPTLKLEPGVLFQQEEFNILVQKILEEKENVSLVAGVTIFSKESQQYNQTITAKKGEIRVDEKNDRLLLRLFDGEVHKIDWENLVDYQVLKFPEHLITIEMPGMKLIRREDEYYSDREMSSKLMLKKVHEKYKNMEQSRERILQAVIPQISNDLKLKLKTEGKLDTFYLPNENNNSITVQKNKNLISTYPEEQKIPGKIVPKEMSIIKLLATYQNLYYKIRTEHNIMQIDERGSFSLLVEIHKKYSIPIACIIFVLVGSALGIISKRGNMAASSGVGLFFFLLYWTFLIGGEELADRQIISPAVAMWSPNLIVGLLGIYLTFAIVKETPLILTSFSINTFYQSFIKLFQNKKAESNHENS